jgi:hypothetical protein
MFTKACHWTLSRASSAHFILSHTLFLQDPFQYHCLSLSVSHTHTHTCKYIYTHIRAHTHARARVKLGYNELHGTVYFVRYSHYS